MQNKSYISTLEQKLLVGFVLFFSLLFYLHFAQFKIDKYNNEVRDKQAEITLEANTLPEERVSFSGSSWEQPLITKIYWFNLFLIFIINFLLWKKRFSLFVLSTSINFFVLFIIFYWDSYNHSSHLFTNLIALSVFIAFVSFFILQLAIITRFVFEKNQAKISFR